MHTLLRRAWHILRQRHFDAELRDEMECHRAMKQVELEHAGLSSDEARRESRRALGNGTLAREDARAVWIWRWLDDLFRDVAYGVRGLRRHPGFTAAAVISLALAIGANTAIFSIMNGLLFRALPVREPTRLALITDAAAAPRARAWDYAIWQEIDRRSPLFDGFTAWSFTRFNLAPSGEAQLLDGLWVSGSFFDVLDVAPALGRVLSRADDQPGAPSHPVAVISYLFWQRQFAGSAEVLGRSLRLDSVPFTIVGVTPRDFFGAEVGRSFDVIVPLRAESLVRGRDSALDRPGQNFLTILARLKTGQSLAAATAVVLGAQSAIRDATVGPWSADLPPQAANRYLKSPFTLIPAATGFSNLRLTYGRPLVILSIIVALVLLIACVNVANLLTARAIARRHELSVRLALGASRGRVARQFLTESLLLSFVAATIGIGIAAFASRLLVRQLSTPANPVFLDVSLDARVLGFTVVLSVATALLFGTAPAFRVARLASTDVLNDQDRATAGSAQGRLSSWLIVVQVALSVVLVAAAGLFIRSFSSLTNLDLGFQPDRVLVVTMDVQRLAIDPMQRVGVFEKARDAVLGLPGVSDAAISFLTPAGGGGFTPQVEVSGIPRATSTQGDVYGNLISPRWFGTFGIRLIAGRDLNDDDRRGAPRVAIVNQAFVRRILGGQSAIGRTLTVYPGTLRALPLEIVGIVADAVYTSPREPAPPTFYGAIAQFDVPGFPFAAARLSVRAASGPPALLTKSVAQAIEPISPKVVLTFQPIAAQLRASLTRERVMALLAGCFGALALLLAGLGLYGVTAYTVSRRRKEIGIRVALGAAPASVTGLMLRRVFGQVAIGIAAGIGISVWGSKFLGGLIYGLPPRDVSTMAGAGAVLSVIGLLAGWSAARRAARMDPMVVLHES